LKSGDVLKIDLGISYKGYITDSAITVAIGEIDPKASELIKITKLALEKAMGECKAGKRVGDIGWVIENTVSSAGFSVVERLTGHGVGFELHEPPSVHNYGEKNTGLLLEPGMVLAIEPMVAIGSGEIREDSRGGFITRDGSLAAHFEHTVLITEGDPEVLTN
jgi:methionyl aminopeptidase